MGQISFDDILSAVTDLSSAEDADDARDYLDEIRPTVERLTSLPEITVATLTEAIEKDPQIVPLLASCIGLTQERLKNQLKHHLGTSGWIKLARDNPQDLINLFDREYNLVHRVRDDISRNWTFADVLVERYRWSRRTAGRAITRGRQLENVVEDVVKSLGLPYQMRTQFRGRGDIAVPCDVAIPTGENALIAGAAKGYNSTGSKLSDAVREIELLANYRLPRQFIFAVIDGIGWKNRLNDMRRIFDLWQNQEIDGLYTLADMHRFKSDLVQFATRQQLLPTDN